MTLQFPQLFAAAALTNAAATYYTVPATTGIVLNNARVRFTNTDSVVRTVTAYAIPSAGTAAAGNCFLNAESIAPNAHLDVDVPQLTTSGFLQAKADANTAVTISALSGVLFTP